MDGPLAVVRVRAAAGDGLVVDVNLREGAGLDAEEGEALECALRVAVDEVEEGA